MQPNQESRISREQELQLLQFLYDKRLTLFNVRRGHEWRVFFGFASLLLAADAAVLTGRVKLQGIWVILACVGFSLMAMATTWYQWELQKRNASDRLAMNYIHDRLAASVGIPEEYLYQKSYGIAEVRIANLWDAWEFVRRQWAFGPQVAFVFLLLLASFFIMFSG